jgi:hypothetical protein
VVSSFDQVGALVTGVAASVVLYVKNSDAAAAHPYNAGINAILEFDDEGSA